MRARCAADSDADSAARGGGGAAHSEAEELAALLAGASVKERQGTSEPTPQPDEPKTLRDAGEEAAEAAPSAAAKFAAFRAEQRGASLPRSCCAAVAQRGPCAAAARCLACAHARAAAEHAAAANAAAEAAAAAEAVADTAEAAAAEKAAVAAAEARAAAGTGAPRVGLVHSPDMELHRGPGDHPECPARHWCVVKAFNDSGLADRCVRLEPRPASDEEVLRAHTREHLDALHALYDPAGEAVQTKGDLFWCKDTAAAARLSAGCAVSATLAVARGELDAAFAVIRPPGHHAECARAMGTCPRVRAAVAPPG